ncbi:cytoplasmic protein [Bacillus toyonensis]|uniref:cytoplasmic protein n=1 Tax=Bacillus toyonensis TaxID=155322 RepID=UPI003D21E197
MANKRQRKKLIKKQQESFLHDVGYSKKKLKTIHTNERSKIVKKETVKKRKRDKYHSLRSQGFSSKEASKMSSWSDKRLTDYLKQLSSYYLIVAYKDVTEETDSEALYQIKQRNKRRSRSSIENSIRGWLSEDRNQGFIGGYEMAVVREDGLSFMHHSYRARKFLIAYQGQGLHLKPLLNLIEEMMVLLYTVEDKDSFVAELVTNLYQLPYEKAHANADYIRENYMIDRSDLHF